ncbi:hydrolase, partial [Stenotrophomonas maltophilia]|nr:hydrolase [Stenotrophomonas maltophilia]
RIGFGDHVRLDVQGDPCDGQMLHVARDTPFGCVLRSRFVLGLGLLRHCYTEFSFLSRLLPSLYYGERANGEAVPLPW